MRTYILWTFCIMLNIYKTGILSIIKVYNKNVTNRVAFIHAKIRL